MSSVIDSDDPDGFREFYHRELSRAGFIPPRLENEKLYLGDELGWREGRLWVHQGEGLGAVLLDEVCLVGWLDSSWFGVHQAQPWLRDASPWPQANLQDLAQQRRQQILTCESCGRTDTSSHFRRGEETLCNGCADSQHGYVIY